MPAWEWSGERPSVWPFPFRREDPFPRIKVDTRTSTGLQVLPHCGFPATRGSAILGMPPRPLVRSCQCIADVAVKTPDRHFE